MLKAIDKFAKFAFGNGRLSSALLQILAVTFCICLLQSCGGSCSRQKQDAAVSPTDREDPRAVLDHPVVFDAQAVDVTLAMVQSDRDLTPGEMSQAIVVAEASVNHLDQILENLKRNDDDADSWHVMTEMNRDGWPAQTAAIVEALSHRPLDAEMRARVNDLLKALEFSRNLVAELRRDAPRLPDIDLSVDP